MEKRLTIFSDKQKLYSVLGSGDEQLDISLGHSEGWLVGIVD
jgi:hypothetical protein